MITFGQAIRNAVVIEQAAASFYRKLVSQTVDQKTIDFLEEMARQEDDHAEQIAKVAERLDAGELPVNANDQVQGVETAPEWGMVENLQLEQALTLAIEGENNAALYYDAMADFAAGEVADFFNDLVKTEQHHAELLREKLKQLNS